MSVCVPSSGYLSVDFEGYHTCRAGCEQGCSTPVFDWQINTLLDLFAETGARATFFAVAQCASRNPTLMGKIVEAGHEVACHGLVHRRIDPFHDAHLQRDLAAAKARLEDVSGACVIGYRAPFFSIPSQAVDYTYQALAHEGFRYSASLRASRRRPVTMRSGVVDIPSIGWRGLPLGSSYLAFWPRRLVAAHLKRCDAAPAVPTLYLHPYNLGCNPRSSIAMAKGLGHNMLARRVLSSLRSMLALRRWTVFREGADEIRN